MTAGPGAGKTEMLAQRADFLLQTTTCRYPQRILAISFKVDAARNLKDRVRKRCGQELASRIDSYTFHAFGKRIIDRFRPALTGQDALNPDYTVGSHRYPNSQITFNDMVPLALQILRTSEVARNAVRQTYSHVFLDEFQDCTNVQYDLVRTLFCGTDIRLTAVGDTKQRIMAWAGALEGIFETFATDFGAGAFNLYQNFRSLPRLRRMQNAMVKVMDEAAAMPDSEIVGEGGALEVLQFATSQEEADTLADTIRDRIQSDGVAASEIAVLIPKQLELYADRLMAELEARKIPFRNEVKLQDLSKEPVARLIIDFLIVVFAERDPDAYERLMHVLLATGLDEDSTYDQRASWYRFIDNVRESVQHLAAKEITSALMKKFATEFLTRVGSDALIGLSVDYEQGNRLEEVIAETFDRTEELLAIAVHPVQALARFSEDNAVRIMTIHKSKGLEFDTVCVLGVEKEMFWGKLPEERAAFFVAISRAKRCLWLTHAAHRSRPKGFSGRWSESRTPHPEFLAYAASAVS
jgi:superfamily I DNA/RNA helicase